ncbi:P-loop containing nucleoside triphosphate hydrolase protein [Rhodocollybia butyracea]|uniref:P-loop containing nucleoside triphosphate hydrolase protein n=1 Tax=Rhodocollybia butyracea TaxID=206335 RepID=A0A9P5PIW2_9AGAR|nr:P-loop containing nucleoside triphosphate hydrolase protein [Rhodocollybia butyracea]
MASDISDTVYASRRKELLALINQLRAVGAQNDLDLPRITVIGNQSAGKSSVVEAISGITVPRDAGTCTRCPMECRLLSSPGPWMFDNDGKRLGEVSEKPFGGIITDKSEVELALRRAQFAILNPQIPFSKILNATAQELKDMAPSEKSMPFSQNVVCVDLEGPELTDLSFVDLPGLIQNAEPEVVKLVEDMVISHIQGNCIILVAIPMTDDIENQKALRLARQEDDTGRRTIGVLTKPDMLGTGSTKAAGLWLDVLEDRRHPLMHGYYCTRQPNDDERSIGIEATKAREAEERFFKTTAPWSRSTNPGRFGTKNLVATLSHSRHGRADATELIRTHRHSYGAFKKAIRQTAPKFVPFAESQKVTDFNNCLDDEEDDPVANVSATDKPLMNLTEFRKHIDRSLTRELPHNVPYEAKTALILQFQTTWPDAVETCFEKVKEITLKILLRNVDVHFGRFNLLRSHIRNLIATVIESHKVKCVAMLKFTLEAERMPYTQNGHYLESATQGWLDKYKAVRSGKLSTDTLDPHAKRRKTDLGAAPTCALPAKGPSTPIARTNNPSPVSPGTPDKSPSREGPRRPAGFKTPKAPTSPQNADPNSVVVTPGSSDVIQKSQDTPPNEAALKEAIAFLVRAGAPVGHLDPKELLGKLIPPDEYETELKVMAEVRGYFQVAYKRMIDNVPRVIDLSFVREIGKTLQPFLISQFSLGNPSANDRCANYLGEDAALVARREELLARRKRLESVEKELEEYSLRIYA